MNNEYIILFYVDTMWYYICTIILEQYSSKTKAKKVKTLEKKDFEIFLDKGVLLLYMSIGAVLASIGYIVFKLTSNSWERRKIL